MPGESAFACVFRVPNTVIVRPADCTLTLTAGETVCVLSLAQPATEAEPEESPRGMTPRIPLIDRNLLLAQTGRRCYHVRGERPHPPPTGRTIF